MNEQTKKLDIALSNINFEVGGAGKIHLSPITRREILRTCKEAGLKFVGKDLKLPPIKNPDAQIVVIEG